MASQALLILNKADKAREQGNDLYREKDYKNSLVQYTNALRLYESVRSKESAQNKVKTLNSRAMLYEKLLEFEKSINDCDGALALDPSNTKALFLRMNARNKLNDWHGLKMDCESLLSRFEKDPTLLKSYEVDKVQTYALIALSSAKADQARENGNKLFGVKDYENCTAAYDYALRLYDKIPIKETTALFNKVKVLTNRALAYQKLLEFEKSINDCDAALALDPSNTKALFLRMNARNKLNDWHGLKMDCESLLSRFEKDPTLLKAAELDKVRAYVAIAKSKTERQPIVSDKLSDGGANVHKLVFSPRSSEGAVEEGWPTGGDVDEVGSELMNKASIDKIKGPCAACYKEGSSQCKRCGFTVYCGRSCQSSHWKFHKKFCTKGLQDPSPKFSPNTRRGLVGLVNLGNSCYMNSAIACLSHVYPISRHFISGSYQAEINRTNDLGSRGDIAENFAALLSQLWFGAEKTVAAKALKNAVDRRTDQFAGFVQHDAAEYLSFLLDMTHEDLNRVMVRKYVEIPDPEDRPDVEVSAELWDLHRKRNDSVVVDTVSGVYKSTITCPQCKTPWRKFDPFNSIELGLPIKSSRALRVMVVRRNPDYVGSGRKNMDTVPTLFSMEITKDTILHDVMVKMAQLSGIPMERLVFWESYRGRIFQILSDPRFQVYRLACEDMIVALEMADVDRLSLKDDVGVPVAPVLDSDVKVLKIVVYHRLGADGGVKGIRGLNLTTNSTFFGEPLVVCVRDDWSLTDLKRHILAQLLHLLKPTDYNELSAERERGGEFIHQFDDAFLSDLSDELLVAQLSSEQGYAQTARSARMGPLANGFYQDVDASLPLRLLFPDEVTYVALEWNKHNIEYVKYSLSFPPVNEHPSVQQFIELEAPMSLDQCFKLYCTDELMEATEAYYCKKCKDHVEGCVKSMRLTRCPEVLIVTLKRFGQQMRRSGYCFPDKLQDMVEFPLNGFDISPYMLPDEGAGGANGNHSTVYDLFGSVNHFGHATFGHYKAYIRGGEWQDNVSPSDKWFEFDDDLVREVHPDNVVCNSAYVLFYRRRPAHYTTQVQDADV